MSYRGGPPQGGGGQHRGGGGGGYRGPSGGGPGGGGPGGVGGGGTFVDIQLNVFTVTQLPVQPFQQYDVLITKANAAADDRELPARRKQDIIDKLQNDRADIFTSRAAFDGNKNLWIRDTLGFQGQEFTVNMAETQLPNGRGLFRVVLQYAATINPAQLNQLLTTQQAQSPGGLSAVSLMQQLVRAAPNTNEPKNARSIFPRGNQNRQHLGNGFGGGLEAFRGFYQSVRPTIGRVLVNVDTTTSAGYVSGPLIKVAMDFLRVRNVNQLRISAGDPNYRKLKGFLKGVKVIVRYKGSRQADHGRPIRDLVEEAGFYSFECDGVETTVKEYFQNKQVQLQHPNIFGVKIGRGAVFPAELCEVLPDQLYKKKVPPELAANMLKFAEQDPYTKIEAIKKAVTQTLHWRTSTVLDSAHMTIDTNPVKLRARILPPPSIRYGGRAQTIQNGAWNVKGEKFLQTPGELVRWAVIDYTGRPANDRAIMAFISALRTNLGRLGYSNVDSPLMFQLNGHNAKAELEAFCAQGLKGQPSLLLAILPKVATEIRSAFKHLTLCHSKFACVSQCVIGDKIGNERGLDQYVNNLALKINVKLGGVNGYVEDAALVELKKRPTMLVGADVSHPSPGVFNRPSLASLVWSFDQHFTRYKASSAVQQPRTEIIDGMYDMMVEALGHFIGQNKVAPERIIMFRDGVSEGEFETVRERECAAIRRAIDKVFEGVPANYTGIKTQLVFLVVGKRHHIRMFPEAPVQLRPGVKVPGGGNLLPGVVVDAAIQSPYVTDWYILSQGGLKGTSVPAHYILLVNETTLPVGLLQQASYALCYSYHRATRSVSIPAPVYYADLICTYAEFQFDASVNFMDELSTVASGEGGQFNLAPWQSAFKPIAPFLRDKFYFM